MRKWWERLEGIFDMIDPFSISFGFDDRGRPLVLMKHDVVVALYDFEPRNSTELRIVRGDTIEVVRKEESGFSILLLRFYKKWIFESWWEGICNGTSGIFPSNYVASISKPITKEEVKEEEGRKIREEEERKIREDFISSSNQLQVWFQNHLNPFFLFQFRPLYSLSSKIVNLQSWWISSRKGEWPSWNWFDYLIREEKMCSLILWKGLMI